MTSRTRIATISVIALLMAGGAMAGDGARPEGAAPLDARCGTLHPWDRAEAVPVMRDTADCTLSLTNPDAAYDPGDLYEIPVVVHIITHDNGVNGNITDEMVQSQIDILNEDYLALAGTPGANGTNTGIRFVLASEDPDGQPTNGITRTANTNWYNDNDEIGFKVALRWDPNRYLNFYLNNTAYLGYAWFPQWSVGTWQDGIVIKYSAFGRNSPLAPYDQGRTATHEVGHWLGLLHTFQGGCGVADAPGCYSSADLICDTDPDQQDTYSCVNSTSCGSYPIPVENYMEYTNDTCMELFTLEQSRRMRCTLTSYRTDLYTVIEPPLFAAGFNEGNLAEWSSSVP